MKTNTGGHQSVTREFRRILRNRINECEAFELPTDGLRRLLRDGVAFAGATRIKDDATIWEGYRHRRRRLKECFKNAQAFVWNDETVYATYYEGYVVCGDTLPLIHHAWLVAGGRVFDATLEAADKKLGRGDKERDYRRYFGLPFLVGEVVDSIQRNQAYVPLLPGL